MATIFVAYPYSYSRDDYRSAFREVAQDFEVEFVYADEQITNKHILEKIEAMIRDADFSLFDITTWNPNVTLELGIARGASADYYILFNPTAGQAEVPADVGGIDRIQYSDYTELKGGLRQLMTQQFGSPTPSDEPTGKEVVDHIEALRIKIPDTVGAQPGLLIGGIASTIGVPIEMAQVIVKPLVGGVLVTRGVRRGTRYYLPDDAPVEEAGESARGEDSSDLFTER